MNCSPDTQAADTTSNFEAKGQLISELKDSNGLTVQTKLHNEEPRHEEILILVVVTCIWRFPWG